MLNLFSPRFQWGSSRNREKVNLKSLNNIAFRGLFLTNISLMNQSFNFQVELTAAELESLRTNFVNAEQRESHLKAQ